MRYNPEEVVYRYKNKKTNNNSWLGVNLPGPTTSFFMVQVICSGRKIEHLERELVNPLYCVKYPTSNEVNLNFHKICENVSNDKLSSFLLRR